MRTRFGLTVGLVVLGLVVWGGSPALADDCVALGGAIVGTECQVSTFVTKSDALHGGPFNIAETLRITGTGKITVPALAAGNPLTINITPGGGADTGQFIMDDGAKIVGDVTTGHAAKITITATGDITLAGDLGNGGALISAIQTSTSCPAFAGGPAGGIITLASTGGNVTTFTGSDIIVDSTKCQAGVVTITALPLGKIDIDGIIHAISGASGTGAVFPGGGRITVIAGCDLTVSDTGDLTSEGNDPGADLVHVEGCTVTINGIVQSIANNAGHTTNTVNACNSDPLAHPTDWLPIATDHIYTACVEVWSGTTITIENNGAGKNGLVSADGVRHPNRGWVDVFANGDIKIIGDAFYAVQANGTTGGPTSNSFGGLITVKSGSGIVSTFAKAIQANAVGVGSDGGDVIVQANLDVAFGTASIQAKGPDGSNTAGGHINAQAFNGLLSGALPGELNAAGGSGGTAVGTVMLTGCGTPAPGDGVNYTGTVTPALPNPVQPDSCGGSPDIPVTLPLATCDTECHGDHHGDCTKATVLTVLDPLTGRYPGNNGPDVVIHVNQGELIQPAIDSASDLNGDGYIILMVLAHDDGSLGGSTTQSVDIKLDYPNTFALFGCSVTLVDPDVNDGLPTGLIEATANSPDHVGPFAPGNIFVMDLHGTGSEVAGWQVFGDGRYMRNVATHDNTGWGMWFIGNGNTMHNGNGNNNLLAGIALLGNGNTVDSADAFGNGYAGVYVVGSSNTLLKIDAGDRGKGNGRGISVEGDSNLLKENDVYASVYYGIELAGNNNTLLKNSLGDAKKGNGLDGIVVLGTGNVLQENEAYANGDSGFWVVGGVNTLTKNTAGDRGDKANKAAGFLLDGGGALTQNKAIGNLGDGFHLTSAGFSLKNNVSGGTGSGYTNGGCEYLFDVIGNTNLGGNKTNGLTLSGALLGCK